MTEIKERDLTFIFPEGCQAVKYDEQSDEWSFYRDQFESIAGGSKAVDILCIEGNTSWLIEIKDYRRRSPENPLPKPSEIADTLAKKVRDTLAGLATAAKKASSSKGDERNLARQALATSRWRVVLHLEQPTTGQRSQPEVIRKPQLLMKIRAKGRLKAIDAHAIVCDLSAIPDYVPWTAFDNAVTQRPAVT